MVAYYASIPTPVYQAILQRSLPPVDYCAPAYRPPQGKKGQYWDNFPLRFWSTVVVVDSQAETCWHWLGTIRNKQSPRAYGVTRLEGKYCFAHRIAYEFCRGPIPDGLSLDHLCRHTLCVNPHHLEPVTIQENVLRGVGYSAENARKTHCKHGHPFDENNTMVRIKKTGIVRYCRQCRANGEPQRMASQRLFRKIPKALLDFWGKHD